MKFLTLTFSMLLKIFLVINMIACEQQAAQNSDEKSLKEVPQFYFVNDFSFIPGSYSSNECISSSGWMNYADAAGLGTNISIEVVDSENITVTIRYNRHQYCTSDWFATKITKYKTKYIREIFREANAERRMVELNVESSEMQITYAPLISTFNTCTGHTIDFTDNQFHDYTNYTNCFSESEKATLKFIVNSEDSYELNISGWNTHMPNNSSFIVE